MNPEAIHAVAYARVSTPKQAVEGESLDIQAKRLRAGAAQHGWSLFPENHVFAEPFTGSTDERPVYESLLKLIKANKGKIKYFIVAYLDRFSREGSLKYQQMKADLAELGVELRDLTGVIQPSVNSLGDFGFRYSWSETSPSQISEIVIAETGRYEKHLILTRLIGAEIKLTQDGYHVGRADDGYTARRIYVDGKKKFAIFPDPERAHYFREMFRLRAEGVHSDKEIVERINAMGFRTKTWNRWNSDQTHIEGRRQGIPLTVKQLQKLIQRPIYCGIMCKKWTHNLAIRAKGGESLVSIEIFNAANRGKVLIQEDDDGGVTALYNQSPLKRVSTRKAYRPDFPYKNIAACSVCRRPFTASYSRGKSGQRFGAYHCARKHPRCAVAQSDLELAFECFLLNTRTVDSFLASYRRIFMAAHDQARAQALAQRTELARKLAALNDRKALLVDAFAEASTSGMRAEIERKLAVIEEQLTQMQDISIELDLSEDEIEDYFRYVGIIVEHPSLLLSDIQNMQEQLALFGLIFAAPPTYEDIIHGTPGLTVAIWLSEEFKRSNSRSVTLPVLSWNTLVEDVRRWQTSYWAIDVVLERKKRRESGWTDLAA